MTTLTIHRGTHEVGGSCVEIRTDKAKILIDLGMPLDYDKHTTEEQGQIRSDAAEWCQGVDALFFTATAKGLIFTRAINCRMAHPPKAFSHNAEHR